MQPLARPEMPPEATSVSLQLLDLLPSDLWIVLASLSGQGPMIKLSLTQQSAQKFATHLVKRSDFNDFAMPRTCISPERFSGLENVVLHAHFSSQKLVDFWPRNNIIEALFSLPRLRSLTGPLYLLLLGPDNTRGALSRLENLTVKVNLQDASLVSKYQPSSANECIDTETAALTQWGNCFHHASVLQWNCFMLIPKMPVLTSICGRDIVFYRGGDDGDDDNYPLREVLGRLTRLDNITYTPGYIGQYNGLKHATSLCQLNASGWFLDWPDVYQAIQQLTRLTSLSGLWSYNGVYTSDSYPDIVEGLVMRAIVNGIRRTRTPIGDIKQMAGKLKVLTLDCHDEHIDFTDVVFPRLYKLILTARSTYKWPSNLSLTMPALRKLRMPLSRNTFGVLNSATLGVLNSATRLEKLVLTSKLDFTLFGDAGTELANFCPPALRILCIDFESTTSFGVSQFSTLPLLRQLVSIELTNVNHGSLCSLYTLISNAPTLVSLMIEVRLTHPLSEYDQFRTSPLRGEALKSVKSAFSVHSQLKRVLLTLKWFQESHIRDWLRDSSTLPDRILVWSSGWCGDDFWHGLDEINVGDEKGRWVYCTVPYEPDEPKVQIIEDD